MSNSPRVVAALRELLHSEVYFLFQIANHRISANPPFLIISSYNRDDTRPDYGIGCIAAYRGNIL